MGRVAFFRCIITTNYDHLLEDHFPPRTAAIISDNEIFTTQHAKTKVYKVHDDIDRPDSMILTSLDYAKMHNRNFKDPFWLSVIHEISTHHVIFLGYGYEDENILADFEFVHQKLKSKNKKRIMVEPKLTQLKHKRLKKLGIEHIELSGEDFVTGLLENIKEHLVEDVRNGSVDTLTAQDIITSFDLEVQIKANREVSEILSIKKTNGPTEQQIQSSTSDAD